MAQPIAVMAQQKNLFEQAKTLASTLKLPLFESGKSYRALLLVTEQGLALQFLIEKNFAPIMVDFLNGPLAHRRQYGGGRHQLLGRAIGLSNKKTLSVLDLTAGLGRDAFVLACLGCHVTMLERHPIMAILLKDALERAEKEPWFRELKLTLVETDAKPYLKQLSSEQIPDVIYLDPMYPERKKSALVKKEMRILRELVGEDDDAGDCLALALKLPQKKKRVVVKRPRLAPALPGPEPSLVFSGKSSRFDVYFSA